MSKTIAVGADHAGFELKESLAETLREHGYQVKDLGTHDIASVDYPDFAHAVAESVASGECELGLLVCGTGQGVCMAVNKHPGIRAAVASETFSARMARQHNNANVLCVGARVVGEGLAFEILGAFLDGEFEGGRHEPRVRKIDRP